MAASNTPVVTVPQPSDDATSREIREYEKILKLTEEVFAGTHPRLKVPEKFVRRAPQATQTTASTTTAATTAPELHAPEQVVRKEEERKTNASAPFSVQPGTATPHVAASSSSTATATTKPASAINPVLLTKSDDLVRAELALQRERIERALREQHERSRIEAKRTVPLQDACPDFNVTQVLNKALEIVKPLPPPSNEATHADRASATVSIDESSNNNDSLYSSRAPDSPISGARPSPESDRRVPEKPAEPRPVTISPEPSRPVEAANKETAPAGPADESMEDDDYSPPEPIVPDNVRVEPPASAGPPPERRQRQHEGPELQSRHPPSPASEVRIVRNHITSPAAPRPSRVSPLATAKVPSVQQSRAEHRRERLTEDPYTAGRTGSPAVAAQHLLPRKRRRIREEPGPRDVHSPAPYIKEEPMSPPPVSEVPRARSRIADSRPAYIDIASPQQYTPPVDRREAPSREPVYEMDRYGREYDVDGHPVRPASRVVRRPVRDTQDLRRVASMHSSASRPVTEAVAREYEPAPPPRYPSRAMRASSYAVVERAPPPPPPPPPAERTRYYDEAVPSYSRHYVEEVPRYREVVVEDEPVPRYVEVPPPPPRRRIVVDEHGNRYYEMVPAPSMRTMPPPAPAPPLRHASVARSTSIVEDGYGSRRYVTEMPPPPPSSSQVSYRRVVDYPAGEEPASAVPLHRPYSRGPAPPPGGDRPPVVRSSSVVVDYGPPRHEYLDEREMVPREQRVMRTSTAGRYVRTGRESVYVDEDGRAVYTAAPASSAPGPGPGPSGPSGRAFREERYYEEEDGYGRY